MATRLSDPALFSSPPVVMWVGRHPDGRGEYLEALREAGAQVLTVEDCGSPMSRALLERPDLTIIDAEVCNEREVLKACRDIRLRGPQALVVAYGHADQIATSPVADAVDFLLAPERNAEAFVQSLMGPLQITQRLKRLAQDNEELRRCVMLDLETGLLNRRGVLERLEAEYQRTTRGHEPVSVLLMRFDERIVMGANSGGPASSHSTFMRSIKSWIRKTDIIGRLNEYEALLILPNTSLQGARRQERRLHAMLEANSMTRNGAPIRLRFLAGAATTLDARVSCATHLLELSDRELFEDPHDTDPDETRAAPRNSSQRPILLPRAETAFRNAMPSKAVVLTHGDERERIEDALLALRCSASFPENDVECMRMMDQDRPDLVILTDSCTDSERLKISQKAHDPQRTGGYTPILALADPLLRPETPEADDFLAPDALETGLEGRMRTLSRLKNFFELFRESENLLRQLQRVAFENDRLRTLGQIAGGVAHNFNNALSVILGRSQLMKARVGDNDGMRDLEMIERAAKDCGEMIRRIQDYLRKDVERRHEIVDLNGVLQDCILMTRSRWKDEAERQSVLFDVQASLDDRLPVQANASELREVFINLFFNAMDAMPNGGSLRIEARSRDRLVTISVTDTGVGIPPQDIERVFEPFYTTKQNKGSGLGLSIVASCIARHGGEVTVQSHPGKGTTFRIELPLAMKALEPDGFDAAGTIAAPESAAEAMRLLIVDDEETIRQVFEDLLEDSGHAVELVASGAEAMERLRNNGPFDVLFTDLGMPGMSGWELAERCQRLCPDTLVVLISGWIPEIDEETLRERHIDYVLPKPLTLDDLSNMLQTLQARVAEIRV